ncbi:pectin lyase-like superfamily protein [Artemisia annua]|uniref:Pectin lyase-like superfamily protein n=1 Tax=Artemisia annua TaxID=35608 RepID=A0A2U1KYL9_ARTAN|nr:pectin lyase-like superfamily protein [Artemisia annua]
MNGQQCEMTFTTCDGVKASRLSISAPASSPNTDGIHISESTDVEVKEATVRTSDDCISIVSNSSKVTVTRIACGPGHGISIESLGKAGTCDQVYDVSVHEAFLSNTENGLSIKIWQEPGRMMRDVHRGCVWKRRHHLSLEGQTELVIREYSRSMQQLAFGNKHHFSELNTIQ